MTPTLLAFPKRATHSTHSQLVEQPLRGHCSEPVLVAQFSVADCTPSSYGCDGGRLWTSGGCRGLFRCTAASGVLLLGKDGAGANASRSCASRTLTMGEIRKHTESYEQKSPREWSLAKAATLARQRRFDAARHWARLLARPNSDTLGHLKYWAGAPKIKDKNSARRSFSTCPNASFSGDMTDSGGYCADFWPTARPCNAFVVGVGNNFKFSRYATARGCSAHAWDPTLELRARHQAGARMADRAAKQRDKTLGVSFHFAGLHGAENGTSSHNSYGSIDAAHMLRLDEMVSLVGGHGGPLRVLTVDCEGCEWSAFEQLAAAKDSTALASVELLLVELHVSPTMVAPTLAQFVAFFDYILHTLGFKLWSLRSNDGYPRDQAVVDFLGVAGLPAGLCCYELGFVRGEALQRAVKLRS